MTVVRDTIFDVLQTSIKEKIFPGCSFALVTENSVETISLGRFTYDDGSNIVTDHTLYDIASLTKVVAPMSLLMMLIDEGRVGLDDEVWKYLPEFGNFENKKEIRISHLLTYTVDYGLAGGAKSLMDNDTAPSELRDIMISLPIVSKPGEKYVYSNITTFIITQMIEKITGKNFEQMVIEKILIPIGMNTATFLLLDGLRENVVPTEITDERGEIRGSVHDETAYHFRKGKISNGSAGLFASITDMAKFVQMIVNKGRVGSQKLFSDKMISLWTSDYYPNLLPVHTPIGWGDVNSKLIDGYHREIVVKGGFTGCFMVADLKQKRGFVLLSNRIYPKRPEDSSNFAELKEKLMATVLG